MKHTEQNITIISRCVRSTKSQHNMLNGSGFVVKATLGHTVLYSQFLIRSL